MPCHAAVIDKPLKLSPDMKVEKALAQLKKKNVEAAIVVDENDIVQGTFSIQVLMKNLLPVSVAMSDGIQLDVTVRAAPGIAKRLKKVYPLTVGELMDRKFNAVYPETPIWEGINYLVNGVSPLVVVEGDNNKFLGMITNASALEELQRMQEGEA